MARIKNILREFLRDSLGEADRNCPMLAECSAYGNKSHKADDQLIIRQCGDFQKEDWSG